MVKFSADLMVHRPVEKVFAWLTNPANQGKFDKSSLKMEVLTPGPWRAGTQFRELRDMGGRQTEVLSELTALEPDRRFVVRSKTGPGWLGIWEFAPEGAGTRLRWTGELTMKGFGRLLEPLLARPMRAQIDRQFAELPQLIEEEISE